MALSRLIATSHIDHNTELELVASMCVLCGGMRGIRDLLGGRLEVGNQIATLVGLLQTGEDHLGAGDVLLGVLQVLEQSILVPGNALGLVGICVGETGCLSSLATDQTMQIGSNLVLATGLHSVALCATLHEQLLALLNITSWYAHYSLYVFDVLTPTRLQQMSKKDRKINN